METLVWMLIVVNGAAGVSSSQYPSKALCEDAMSMARTGMTVEENKAANIERERYRQEALKKYQESHPPHTTTKADEKQCGDARSSGMIGYGSSADYCVMEKDGMTRFYQGGGLFSVFGSTNPAQEIKYAKCVIINPSDK